MRILIALALIGFISCTPRVPTPAPYHDAPTQFIVIDIQQLDGMKEMTTYEVEIIDVNGLVTHPNNSDKNLKFTFCDSLGKYKLGQPIHFDKNR